MVASVPELTSRTCSSGRTRRTTSSTSETSPGCGAPKESPRPAASCTASTTCSFACPRIIGPQDPTRSTNSRPSASCSMAPEAEVMNGGVPPTLPKARTGEFTPEGVTCWARVNRSDEAEWVMGGLLRIGGSSDGGREGAGNRARDGGREGAGNRARDGAGDWPRDEGRTVLRSEEHTSEL